MTDSDHGLRLWTARLVPPAVMFVGTRICIWLAALHSGYRPFDPHAWSRWDSGWYVAIAHKGYTFLPCAPPEGSPEQWCGSTGWFPGYPWMIWLLERTGLSGMQAGIIISTAFTFGALVLLWVGFLDSKPTVTNVLVLALAAFFPGGIYYSAIFPLSALMFFTLLLIYLLVHNKWVLGAAAGFMAAIIYPSGALLAPVAALWMIRESPTRPNGATLEEAPGSEDSGRERRPASLSALARIAVVTGSIVLGSAFIVALQRYEVGVWGAYFKVQVKYGLGINNPVSTFAGKVSPIFSEGPKGIALAPPVQTLFVAVLMITLLVTVLVKSKQAGPADLLGLATAVVFWIFPLVLGGHLSLYRSESALLPLVIPARLLPRPVLATFVAGAVALTWPMAMLFFKQVLV